MAHTDVVPVEDETLWEHPPFSATIDRERVYGRGADDDKADVVAYCMALVLLALELQLLTRLLVDPYAPAPIRVGLRPQASGPSGPAARKRFTTRTQPCSMMRW